MRQLLSTSTHADTRNTGIVDPCMGEDRSAQATKFVSLTPCPWTPIKGGTP